MQRAKELFDHAKQNSNRAAATAKRHMFVFSAAILFFFVWMGLNHKVAYVGEGFDGNGSSVIAAVLFWLWANHSASRSEKNLREGEMPNTYEQIVLKLMTACFAIPTGRVLFSILPPWENGIGAILAMCISGAGLEALLTKGRGRFVHNRGPELITTGDVRTQLRSQSKGTEPEIEWAGFRLPGELAEGNFLTVGAIGTGKTRMHRELMASVFSTFHPDTDRRGLVYDVKSDALAELASMNLPCEVRVMDPYDVRSWAWDVAADIQDASDAMNFAQAFFPDSGGGTEKRYFADAARNIVAAVIERLNERQRGKWTLRDLILVLSSRERMTRFLDGADVVAEYFSDTEAFEDTRSTIANSMRVLRPIAACWERTSKKFSLKEWLTKGGSVLVLAGKPDELALQVVNRIICKILAAELLKGIESPQQSRFWFFCDELRDAGRLDSLSQFLNGRSKGVRCVLGFQDLEGVTTAFGSRDYVHSMANNCRSISWLKLASTDTADWASKRIGDSEKFEYFDAQGKDGTTVTEHLTKRETILPSEFLHQDEYVNGIVTGIHILKSVQGIWKSSASYRHPDVLATDNFNPRPASDKTLAAWTNEDAERLRVSASLTKPSATDGDSKESGLDEIGRLDFN